MLQNDIDCDSKMFLIHADSEGSGSEEGAVHASAVVSNGKFLNFCIPYFYYNILF